MASSCSLAPRFVNDDDVTAEIIYSTVHARHEVLLGHGLCAIWIYEFHLESSGIYRYITTVSIGSATRGENRACLLLRLICQPGERLCCVRLCYGCCYGFCISQEREEQHHLQGAAAAGCRRAERSYSTFKIRRGGCEKILLVQGKDQLLRFAGAAVKR